MMDPLNCTLLLIFMLWAVTVFCHAVMDNIKDYRTHLRLHPYGDFWHLLQYNREIAIFFTGWFSHQFMIFASIAGLNWVDWLGYIIVVFIAGISFRVVIWNTFYLHFKEKFLKWDQQNFIDVGPKWLQKLMGFHW